MDFIRGMMSLQSFGIALAIVYAVILIYRIRNKRKIKKLKSIYESFKRGKITKDKFPPGYSTECVQMFEKALVREKFPTIYFEYGHKVDSLSDFPQPFKDNFYQEYFRVAIDYYTIKLKCCYNLFVLYDYLSVSSKTESGKVSAGNVLKIIKSGTVNLIYTLVVTVICDLVKEPIINYIKTIVNIL